MIDTALRRRFEFIEMQPDSATLKDVLVDGIDIAEMLDTINKRITVLLDRTHHRAFLFTAAESRSDDRKSCVDF
jgi:hypothetical protein